MPGYRSETGHIVEASSAAPMLVATGVPERSGRRGPLLIL